MCQCRDSCSAHKHRKPASRANNRSLDGIRKRQSENAVAAGKKRGRRRESHQPFTSGLRAEKNAERRAEERAEETGADDAVQAEADEPIHGREFQSEYPPTKVTPEETRRAAQSPYDLRRCRQKRTVFELKATTEYPPVHESRLLYPAPSALALSTFEFLNESELFSGTVFLSVLLLFPFSLFSFFLSFFHPSTFIFACIGKRRVDCHVGLYSPFHICLPVLLVRFLAAPLFNVFFFCESEAADHTRAKRTEEDWEGGRNGRIPNRTVGGKTSHRAIAAARARGCCVRDVRCRLRWWWRLRRGHDF